MRRADRRYLLGPEPYYRPATTTAHVGLRPNYHVRGTFCVISDACSSERHDEAQSWPLMHRNHVDELGTALVGGCIDRSTHKTRCPGLVKDGQCGFHNKRKLEWHKRRYCHCVVSWRKKTTAATHHDGISNLSTAGGNLTAANQLKILQSTCSELQGKFPTMPPLLRAEVMYKINELANLLQAFTLLTGLPDDVSSHVQCPYQQGIQVSLNVALLMALEQSRQSQADHADLIISALVQPGRISIDDTHGQRLRLRGSQLLSLKQFQNAAWAAFHKGEEIAGQPEMSWKAQVANIFFPEDQSQYPQDQSQYVLTRANFVSRARLLLNSGQQEATLAHQLGITDIRRLDEEAGASWEKILSHDDWHDIPDQHAYSVGSITCESLQIGGSAKVELHGLQINGTRKGERALVVRDNADVALVGCDISGGGNGIYIANNASVKVSKTLVRDCGSTGVVVADCAGKCSFQDCQISGNLNLGIAIGGASVTEDTCTLQDVIVKGNETFGISLFGGACATWLGMDTLLEGNGQGSVRFQNGSRLRGFGAHISS